MDDDESGALFPFSSIYNTKLTNEEFNLFHRIDRKLFYRLVRRIGRDVSESMHMVAFLIWLERAKYSHNAVSKVVDWPLNLVNQLCTEVTLCLKRLENTNMCYRENYNDMCLIRKLCVIDVKMNHFNENRYKVIGGVSKMIAEVCMRAFEDIISGRNREVLDADHNAGEKGMNVVQNPSFVPPRPRLLPLPPPPPPPQFYPSNYNGDKRMFVRPFPPPLPPRPPFNFNVPPRGFPQLGFGRNLGFPNFRPRQELGRILVQPDVDLSEIFGGMKLVDGCEDEPHVHPDERTIFLTFSKGYYIPESEIREFFTRIFGNFIEGIYMEEVNKNEQPLFARMVCRSSSIIPAIAPSGTKEKYSINGKHIWAKKYVRKDKHRGSSSAGTSSSSAAATTTSSDQVAAATATTTSDQDAAAAAAANSEDKK